MIRLHALHRRSAGTNALVVLRDTIWEDSQQIIGTMEVDLSAGTQLVYMFPDMVLSIDDFHNHVEVAIQTHGYDTWQGVWTTLWITSQQLASQQYLRPQPARYSVDQHDREILGNDHLDEDEEHFIGICLQDPQTQHIPCDICFCEDCLNEARTLEEEPLNKAKRSNKPKRSKQRSWEKWSTLGEPSGKWDYYVRYDTPTNTVPIEEIAATGWGDEFSDSEATPGKVTILDKKDDWDDDERGGGKILVLQEQFSQNQQDFLDEYLPQWDDQLAIQKHKSEMEWENPFAAKRGEDHTVLHLSKNEEKDDDLPYLKFRKFKQLAAQIINKHEEHAFPTAADDAESSTSYQPPPDAIMGPAVYPPARQNPQPTYKPDYQFGYPQGKGNTFYGGYGVLPGIKFYHNFVSEMYKDATLAKELRNLSLCSAIPIPDTPLEEAAFMAIEGINESDNEQSIEEDYYSHHAFMFHPGPPTKIADMVQSAGSWKPDKELPTQSKSYEHDWKENTNYLAKQSCQGKLRIKSEEEQDFHILKYGSQRTSKGKDGTSSTDDQRSSKDYYKKHGHHIEKEELWQSRKQFARINTIIKRVGGAKIFSKFDLKSGFHQVAMDEESIPWTAFLVPGGLYEWLVMPFGLKNAPAVFQRKMDKCFKGTESFIAVYIDDILVFSKNEKEHAKPSKRKLKICER
ncbi:Orf y [Tanacetum coccineum]